MAIDQVIKVEKYQSWQSAENNLLFYFLAKNQSEEKWVLSVLHTFGIFCEWRKITLSEKNSDKLCRPQFRRIQQNFTETCLTRNSTYCNARPPWSERLGKC